MIAIFEHDKSDTSVETCKVIWGYAMEFASRQPKEPSIREKYEDLRYAAQAVVNELQENMVNTPAIKRLMDSLDGKSFLYLQHKDAVRSWKSDEELVGSELETEHGEDGGVA